MARLDPIKTAVTERDMTSAVATVRVTARAEQTPSTWRVIGFSRITGSRRVRSGE
jgi:hypothetical protein